MSCAMKILVLTFPFAIALTLPNAMPVYEGPMERGGDAASVPGVSDPGTLFKAATSEVFTIGTDPLERM